MQTRNKRPQSRLSEKSKLPEKRAVCEECGGKTIYLTESEVDDKMRN